jgi:hypothetical protein
VASFSERVNVDFAASASVSVGYGTKLRRRQRRPENRTGNGAKDPLDRAIDWSGAARAGGDGGEAVRVYGKIKSYLKCAASQRRL